MLEVEMEDLLWNYPDDFFPRYGFKKATRQFRLSDAGRLDISFTDDAARLWVIEVKAVAVRIEVANQVYRYAEALKRDNPTVRIVPAVVSPMIGSTVRADFDHWGIEHFEIPEAVYRRVAGEHGLAIDGPPPATALTPKSHDQEHSAPSQRRSGETDEDIVKRVAPGFMKAVPSRLRTWVNMHPSVRYPMSGSRTWRRIRMPNGKELLGLEFLDTGLECFLLDPERKLEAMLTAHFGKNSPGFVGRGSPNRLDWQPQHSGWNFVVTSDADFALLTSILEARLKESQ